jgi:hypothetical protein
MPFPEDIFPNNPEVLNAFNLAEFTSRPLYITGKAGTGKSTFLKHYCQNTHKKFLLLAPTGLAALNIGGQTIHSFFGLPWRPILPNDRKIPYFPNARYDENNNLVEEEHPKRKIIRNVDVIIIDEISMVRPDLIDAIDNSLRKNGGDSNLPFGGKQIIFIGDLFQLAPVVKREELPIITRFYDSPFFFSARIFQQIQFSNIEFKKVYRQSDPNFIALLDKIRKANTTPNDFVTLHSRYNPQYEPERNLYFIILCTTNEIADNLNLTYLQNLDTPEFSYVGRIDDRFEGNLPAPLNLTLRVGAQVMFVKNDRGGRWVNGTIGKVTELTNELVKVKIKSNDIEVEYPIERVRWEKTEYKWNDETQEIESEVVGRFTQYPLKLAWAITIHKSQGLTFDQVIINSGNGMFAHGQCYVALSRCTSFEGLVLKTHLNPTDIIVDNRVVDIANTANNQNTINSQLLAGLLDRVRVLTDRYTTLRDENRELQKRLQEKNQNISELQKQNQKHEQTINELKLTLTEKEKEIERLQKVKWYQKLVGAQ